MLEAPEMCHQKGSLLELLHTHTHSHTHTCTHTHVNVIKQGVSILMENELAELKEAKTCVHQKFMT